MKKSQVWISTVIWILIGVLVITLLLSFGLPVYRRTKERVIYEQVVNQFQTFKEVVDQVLSEGPGAQREVELYIPKGEVKAQGNSIVWEAETKEQIIEPMSVEERQGVIIASDADVSAQEQDNQYILENSYVRFNITKVSGGTINASKLIKEIYIKSKDITIHPNFRFYLLNDTSTEIGQGYTTITQTGTNLVYSTVIAHINSTKVEYDIFITLYSHADFVRIKVENVNIK